MAEYHRRIEFSQEGSCNRVKRADPCCERGWHRHRRHSRSQARRDVEVNCETDFVARNEESSSSSACEGDCRSTAADKEDMNALRRRLPVETNLKTSRHGSPSRIELALRDRLDRGHVPTTCTGGQASRGVELTDRRSPTESHAKRDEVQQ